MAEDLDDGEFWLPSEFLGDEVLMEKKLGSLGSESGSSGVSFPCEFPYELGSHGFAFDSSLSSPVESVGSTETESDEEEYMAGLTRKMAHSMLEDDDKSAAAFNRSNFAWASDVGFGNSKPTMVAGSPQSTLCEVGSWSGSNGSRGSSNGPSQVSSPPSTPVNQKDDAWDLLFAAAGQVVRMKMNDEDSKFQARGLLGPPRKPVSQAPAMVNNGLQVKNYGFSAYPCQASTQQQLQSCWHGRNNDSSSVMANQFQPLKQHQQQVMKQQQSSLSSGSVVLGRQAKVSTAQPLQSRARAAPGLNNRCGRPLGLSTSAWPPLQQPPGSGMRAVFLGSSGSRRETGGTGVFLPRRVGNPAEIRKKPECSTVLLPARVVQALNLNLDDMGARPCFQGGFIDNHETHAARATHLHQKHNLRHQSATSNEIRLPQEWTY